MRGSPRWGVACWALMLGVVACGGGDGPANPTPLTLSLSSSKLEVQPGEGFELNWTSQSATACEVSGGWEGPRPTEGIEQISSITSSTAYEIKCWNKRAAVTTSLTVQLQLPTTGGYMAVTAEHDGSAVTLLWQDRFPDATAYFVDSSIPGGIWQKVTQLPGHISWETIREWQGTAEKKTRFRVRVQTSDGEYVISGSSGKPYLTIDPDRSVEFIVESPEPIGIGTYLSLQPIDWIASGAYIDIDSNFEWYVSGPEYRSYLDTGQLSSGRHWLTAKVLEPGREVTTVVHRNLIIDKSGIGATTTVDDPYGYGPHHVVVRPYTDSPVTRVTFLLDGVAQGFLEEPNRQVYDQCCGLRWVYEWTWDVSGLSSGSYSLGAKIQSADGLTQTGEEAVFELRKPPQLVLARPVDYELVGDTLTVSGTVDDDVGGVYVKTSVWGPGSTGVVCYWDFGISFDRTCDISSLPDGRFSVEFEVRNSAEKFDFENRVVLRSTSAASRFSRAFEIENGWLAGVENGTLLFAHNGRVKLRHADGQVIDITPPGELIVPDKIPLREQWRSRYLRDMRLQISEGSVAIDGTAGTYVWRDGETGRFPSAHHPVLKWPWLLIEYDSGLILRDLQLGTKLLVHTRMADMGYCGHDFAVDSKGWVNVYFCHGPRYQGTAEVPSGDISRYSTATGLTTVITTDGRYNWPRTDGKRVIFAAASGQLINGSYPIALEGYWLGSGTDRPAKAQLGEGFVAWESRQLSSWSGALEHRGVLVMSPDGQITDVGSSLYASPQLLLDMGSGRTLFRGEHTLFPGQHWGTLNSWQSGMAQEVVPWEVKSALIDNTRTIFSMPSLDPESMEGEIVFLEN